MKDYTWKANCNIYILKHKINRASENDKYKFILAINLVRLRNDNGKSQIEVCEHLGINQSNLCQWEKGIVSPSLRYLIALSEYYHTSIDDLLHLNL